jgi:PPOX class probable F420-dependent enzyme
LHTEAREPRLLSGKVILTGGFCLATAWLQYLLTSGGSRPGIIDAGTGVDGDNAPSDRGAVVSFVMTAEERMTFLAGEHLGVLAVERDGRAPLAVPVWYDYEPGGDILVWMDRDSVKDKLIKAAGRFSYSVHNDVQPYKYVTAEGPVVAHEETPTKEQALRIARRYLSEEEAEKYVSSALGEHSVLVRMRPEKWLSNDQSKTA